MQIKLSVIANIFSNQISFHSIGEHGAKKKTLGNGLKASNLSRKKREKVNGKFGSSGRIMKPDVYIYVEIADIQSHFT